MRILAILHKEFMHIYRDWQMLLIVLLMPLAMIFLYGYALRLEVREVNVAAECNPQSTRASEIVSAMEASSLFKVQILSPKLGETAAIFRSHPDIKAVIRIPQNLDLLLAQQKKPWISFEMNGLDPNTATVLELWALPFFSQVIQHALRIKKGATCNVESHVLYNQEQKSATFFVPGLLAFLLIVIASLLTSMTVARERESGTLDLLLVSPVRRWEIALGKLIPYSICAAIDAFLILLCGRWVFHIECMGSVILLSVLTWVYIFTCLALGLLFSVIARTQREALLMVVPATLMPTFVLSGFIFPVSAMPQFLQFFSALLPSTYFLEIVRGIILKGVGLGTLLIPLCVLIGQFFLFFMVSIQVFRMRF